MIVLPHFLSSYFQAGESGRKEGEKLFPFLHLASFGAAAVWAEYLERKLLKKGFSRGGAERFMKKLLAYIFWGGGFFSGGWSPFADPCVYTVLILHVGERDPFLLPPPYSALCSFLASFFGKGIAN